MKGMITLVKHVKEIQGKKKFYYTIQSYKNTIIKLFFILLFLPAFVLLRFGRVVVRAARTTRTIEVRPPAMRRLEEDIRIASAGDSAMVPSRMVPHGVFDSPHLERQIIN